VTSLKIVHDQYNLWYLLFCAAVEQTNHNEKGEVRGTVLDEGHGGMQLQDFTRKINSQLESAGSTNRVTDARVLSLRMYTSSTFRQFNAALRQKGSQTSEAQGELRFKACVQSARSCVLSMQAIRRPAANTFRGITGYLTEAFEHSGMGMDFGKYTSAHVCMCHLRAVLALATCNAQPGSWLTNLSVPPTQRSSLPPPTKK